MAKPKRPHKQLSSAAHRECDEPLNKDIGEEENAEDKLLKERARKARNQRRYYANHKDSQQAKARRRSANNRLRIKHVQFPASDNGYYSNAYLDDCTPSLVPVFDPTFTVSQATLVSPVDLSTKPLISNQASDNEDESEVMNFVGWESWTAPRRIDAIRCWVVSSIHQYGPLENWGEAFSRDWGTMKSADELVVERWLDMMKGRIRMGRRALTYLEHAMDGELSTSIEEWRDLYTQSQQLARQLWGAVLGVQHRMDCSVSCNG